MITGIILASGFSRRMGMQKLLMRIGGKPMLERVIGAIKASNIKDIILVYNDDKISYLGDQYGIKTVYNPNPMEGQSNSIKCGIEASNVETRGYMFFVGDQPYLEPLVINSLLDQFHKGLKSIIIPRYDGQQGNPVIFHGKYKEELLRLQGDMGGRIIIHDNPQEICYLDFDNPLYGKDIDTWEVYEEFKDCFQKDSDHDRKKK